MCSFIWYEYCCAFTHMHHRVLNFTRNKKKRRRWQRTKKARTTRICWCEIWISDQICLIARISLWWAQFILLYACNHVHSFVRSLAIELKILHAIQLLLPWMTNDKIYHKHPHTHTRAWREQMWGHLMCRERAGEREREQRNQHTPIKNYWFSKRSNCNKNKSMSCKH